MVALLLQPALLVHFALVFPERRGTLWPKLLAVYSVPVALLAAPHLRGHWRLLDFLPSISSRDLLDQIELLYLGVYFLLAAGIFLASYFRAPSGILRQQLKWVTGGTLAGILPFLRLYVFAAIREHRVPQSWMKLSVFSLALIPLCFGYAIIRYRLMDVDIIFKRGLAYTFATGAVVAIYFLAIALIGELSHTTLTAGPAGAVIAIVVAAFLIQPLRDWVQARLDHFFYRDRLDYRRTLIEFGRALTNEVRLEPLLGSVLDRISQTLLVDRLAVFLEDPAQPGQFVLSRSMGLPSGGPLDLSFLDPARPALDARLPVFRIGARRHRRKRIGAPHARRARPELFHRLPLPRPHRRRARPGQDGGRRLPFKRRPGTAFHHRRLCGHRDRKRPALSIARTKGRCRSSG